MFKCIYQEIFKYNLIIKSAKLSWLVQNIEKKYLKQFICYRINFIHQIKKCK